MTLTFVPAIGSVEVLQNFRREDKLNGHGGLEPSVESPPTTRPRLGCSSDWLFASPALFLANRGRESLQALPPNHPKDPQPIEAFRRDSNQTPKWHWEPQLHLVKSPYKGRLPTLQFSRLPQHLSSSGGIGHFHFFGEFGIFSFNRANSTGIAW
jgi:hypothetical protein